MPFDSYPTAPRCCSTRALRRCGSPKCCQRTRELVVYTNSIPVGSTLHSRGIAVVTLGGRIRPPTMAGVGALTAAALAAINVDVAFLGTNALSFDRGLTTPDADEAT